MTRNVNTIAFAGRKAVINSFSDHPLLVADMHRQLAEWTARFPNATVQTERMSDAECMKLVAAEPRNACWDIGEASAEAMLKAHQLWDEQAADVFFD